MPKGPKPRGLPLRCNFCEDIAHTHEDLKQRFKKAGSCVLGYRAQCMACHRREMRERYAASDIVKQRMKNSCTNWRNNNRARRNQREKQWRLRNYSLGTCSRLRTQCKKLGIPFNLTPADLPLPAHCPVLGIPIIYNPMPGIRPDSTPTVDRVDPCKGYVRGNVQVISMRANRLKQDATIDEIRAVLAYVEKHLPLVPVDAIPIEPKRRQAA